MMGAGVKLSGKREGRAKAVAGGELELTEALCLFRMKGLRMIKCS